MAYINRAHLGSLSTVTALNVSPQGSIAPCTLRPPADSPLMWRDLKRFPCLFPFFFFHLVFVLNVLRPGVSITRYNRVLHVTMRLYLDNQNKCSSAFIFFPLRFFSIIFNRQKLDFLQGRFFLSYTQIFGMFTCG